ncbi:MAG: HAD hydrolase-like protein, partial [Hyphomicrobium sp.]
AMAEAGSRPDATVMIGDTTFDMDMAQAAGVRPIGVGWGYHPARALAEAGAHTVAHDADTLLGHLRLFSGEVLGGT